MLVHEPDLDNLIKKFVLQNALFYNGKANSKAVLGKILAERPELRSRVQELIQLIDKSVAEVNSKSIDEKGNLTLSIKEHIAFPEILPERAKDIFSLEVTVVTTAKTKEEGLELFKLLGFPIKINHKL